MEANIPIVFASRKQAYATLHMLGESTDEERQRIRGVIGTAFYTASLTAKEIPQELEEIKAKIVGLREFMNNTRLDHLVVVLLSGLDEILACLWESPSIEFNTEVTKLEATTNSQETGKTENKTSDTVSNVIDLSERFKRRRDEV